MSNVLKMAGFDVVVNKISITSKELAVKHKFLSSPTIRVNGRDIQPNIRESACEGCADLCTCGECGLSGLDTRRNRIHNAPKEFIVNAILREVYSGTPAFAKDTHEYRLPHNLEVFFRER